jgi:pimeloyl-ACP methyl ester carboxylesterase
VSLRFWTSIIGTVILLWGIILSSFTGYGEAITVCQETTEEGTPGGQIGCVTREFRFEGEDGVQLIGNLYAPDSKESLHTGVVIYHGFDGSKDNLSWIADSLVEKGYTALAYDHRGHGDSGGDLDWGKMVKDAKTAITSLLDECPDIDHIVVIGHSVGGMIAMRVAADGDSEISATVSLSAPESLTETLKSIISYQFEKLVDYIKDFLPTVARSSKSYPAKDKPLLKNLHPKCYTDLPKFYLDSCKSDYRPMYYVDKVDKILFLQGTDDQTASPEGALKMCEKAGEPKALKYIENAEHTLTEETLNEEELEQISKYICDWIEGCLSEEVPAPYACAVGTTSSPDEDAPPRPKLPVRVVSYCVELCD